jgi:hypothetical protein
VSTIVWLENEWGGVVAPGATPHILTSVSGPTYNCDPYRGPVLTSAPPIAYPNATQPAFPYGGFSFGPNFSMTSRRASFRRAFQRALLEDILFIRLLKASFFLYIVSVSVLFTLSFK